MRIVSGTGHSHRLARTCPRQSALIELPCMRQKGCRLARAKSLTTIRVPDMTKSTFIKRSLVVIVLWLAYGYYHRGMTSVSPAWVGATTARMAQEAQQCTTLTNLHEQLDLANAVSNLQLEHEFTTYRATIHFESQTNWTTVLSPEPNNPYNWPLFSRLLHLDFSRATLPEISFGPSHGVQILGPG